MTSGRFRFPTFPLTTLVGALALASSACGGGSSQGCTQCAPIEGRYTLVLEPGTNPSSCSGVTVTLPQGPLDVSRQDSDISAELDGLTLRGTLYQTNDFSLVGNSLGQEDGGTPGPESATLAGLYVPGVGDGGVPRLVGDWQGNFSSTSAGGTKRCSVTRSFTATRQ
ncbi:hypothetical protein [Vitiosangium sp. GDMCC 1.1324]|uniref:hypothetical protein n=1 Tax=Vitiosangium sp. (strain GDMCC 1.1324) TaxID=2138576 RepID=UPI000D33FC91|nr:hypothetical protein [Vitiosangium sp. GDMCC 1.1324]PTL85404.1 hypothetical protein DAT35_01410 [Vitiosangium sp. GDMCC 1.1324]